MPMPFELISLPEDTDYVVIKTSRISKAHNQILADIASENSVSQSDTLRVTSLMGIEAYLELAKGQGIKVGSDLEARINHLQVMGRIMDRESVEKKLHHEVALAMRCNDEQLRAEGLASCQKLAERYGIAYPLKDMSISLYNPEAARILDKVMELMHKEGSDRVAIRDVERSINRTEEQVLPILKQYEVEGKLQIEEGQRSGSPTKWIIMPSILIAED